jgi:hypothetical protein
MRQPLKFIGGLAAALALLALLPGARAQTHYRVAQSTGATITPGTDLVPGSRCDDCVAPVTLPFNFTHYGQTFPAGSAAFVSSNGNLQFATANNDYGQFGVCFPLAQFGNSIIAHWTDIQTGGDGEGVFTSVTGTAPNRTFNVEWRASYEFFTPGSLNFEIRLFETPTADGRRFEIVYGTLGASATSAPGEGVALPAVGAQGPGGGPTTAVNSACGLAGGGLRSGTRLAFISDAAPFSIHGRVTNTEGQPLANVTVSLSGTSNALQTTDSDGHYSFAGLTPGAAYTVAASDGAASNYYPRSRQFPAGGSVVSLNGTKVVNFVRTPEPGAGDLLISEFRFRGPGIVITEDFVELYNNTDAAIVVNTADGSSGWLVVSPNNRSLVIPNGTVIPARRHYLVAGSGYSNLYQYAPGDEFYSGDIENDTGVAVFSTVAVNLSNAAGVNAALAKRLDAAGFTGACAQEPCAFREGAGLAPIGGAMIGVDTEYSFVRKFALGRPVDTDDNAADFQLVSTGGGAIGGAQSILGAPGPENLYGPAERNARLKSSLISPCTGQSTDPDSTCARVRIQTSEPNAPQGTLLIRRRWTNKTGAALTRLRFRVVDITTLNSPGYAPGNGQADLRVLDSQNRTVGQGTIALRGMTVEDAPPAQTSGGGLNTSVRVGDVTLSAPLAHGASINVEFRLGVAQPGTFRFVVNVESVGDEPLTDMPGGNAPARALSQTADKRIGGKQK